MSRVPMKALSAIAYATALLLVAPAAYAEPGGIGTRGAVIAGPTEEQRGQARTAVQDAKLIDPSGFELRMRMLRESRALREYLGSMPTYDVTEQMEFAATQLPTEVLRSLILLTDQGSIRVQAIKGADQRFRASLKVQEKTSGSYGGGMGRMSVSAPLVVPQCGAAWTAFWAWFAVNRGYCAIIGFFGPWAALGCAAAMAVAGAVMDFNRAC